MDQVGVTGGTKETLPVGHEFADRDFSASESRCSKSSVDDDASGLNEDERSATIAQGTNQDSERDEIARRLRILAEYGIR